MIKIIPFAFLLIGTCVVSYGSIFGVQYSDANLGYSIELPDDWTQIPQDVVVAVQRRMTAGGSLVLTYAAAYEPKSNLRHFQYPYVLVEITPYAGSKSIESVSESDLKEMAGKLSGISDQDLRKNISPEVSKALESWTPGTVTYFTDPPGYRSNFEIQVPLMGKVRGMTRALLAKEHIISINMYALEDQWDTYGPLFGQMMRSFSLRPDKQVPLATSSPVDTVINWGIIGAVVGFISYLRRRKKTQAPTPAAEGPALSPGDFSGNQQ